jgi:serine protease Do
VESSIVLVVAVDTEMEGTGVVWEMSDPYAYILTCNHVIKRADGKAVRRIRVTLPSGSTVAATVVGRDPSCDLAVLRVRAKTVVAAALRTDLSRLLEDDYVVAVAQPMLENPVVSGRVIGLYRDIEYPDPALTGIDEVIESTAPLEHGFSGGPLLDQEGRVIGINMAKFIDEPGGISLPADFVVKVAERLMAAK